MSQIYLLSFTGDSLLSTACSMGRFPTGQSISLFGILIILLVGHIALSVRND